MTARNFNSKENRKLELKRISGILLSRIQRALSRFLLFASRLQMLFRPFPSNYLQFFYNNCVMTAIKSFERAKTAWKTGILTIIVDQLNHLKILLFLENRLVKDRWKEVWKYLSNKLVLFHFHRRFFCHATKVYWFMIWFLVQNE